VRSEIIMIMIMMMMIIIIIIIIIRGKIKNIALLEVVTDTRNC